MSEVFKIILILALFTGPFYTLYSQTDDVVFERINTSHGLSNNLIQYIFQDSKGYLWVGTDDGLNKYDGYDFAIYRNDPQDTSSLSHNHVFSIFEDSSKTLWIATEDGLNRFNPATDNFTIFRYDSSPISNAQIERFQNTVTDIQAAGNNQLWISTPLRGLVKFDKITKDFSFFTFDSSGSPLNNAVYRFIRDKNDKNILWVCMWDRGLLQYNIKQDTFQFYQPDAQDKNSLSHKQVRTITQDKDGLLWITTEGGGLNRFNPETKQFKHYRHDQENANSISNDFAWSVFQDPDQPNFLWIGTRNGLNKFDKNKEIFTSYFANVNDPTTLSSSFAFDIYKDRSGVLWIGTVAGLNKIDPGRVPFRRITTAPGKSNSLSDENILDIEQSYQNPNILWLATRGGLNQFNRSTNSFLHYKNDPKNPTSISGNIINTLYEDPDESGEFLWMGVAGNGLTRFDIKKNRFKGYGYDPGNPQSISSNNIRRIYETRDGMLWLTTSSGLNKFDRKKETFTRYLNQDTTYNEALQNLIQELASTGQPLAAILKVKDDEDRYQEFNLTQRTQVLIVGLGEGTDQMWDYGWLESSDGKILWTLKQDESRHAGGAEKNRMQIINLTLDAGSYVLHYKSDDSHSYGLWNLPAPLNQNLWGISVFQLSNQQYNLVSQNIDKAVKPSSIVSSNTTALLEDSYGLLWIGTDQNGLSKLDRKTGRFTNYVFNAKDPNSLSDNRIYDIVEDNSGNIWIGTVNGLNRYDQKSDSFRKYFRRDGLPGNRIISTLEDQNGSIWLTTNNGISKFNPADEGKDGYLTFINYNVKDGLPYDQYVARSRLRTQSGDMFFGAFGGFVSFVPGKRNPVPPQTLISKFLLFNHTVIAGEDAPLKEHISEAQSIELEHDLNVFAFEFTGLHFTRPEKNRYLYKLEGFDKDWIDGSRRYAPYSNLDPGEYIFKVKSANSDGVWDQQGAQIMINILPPWWRTTTAYISFGVLLVLIGFGLDRFQRRRLMAKAKERMKIQAAEHRAEAAELQARAVQAENERKSKELEEARELQLSMLPKELPQLPHLDIAVYMQTATEVGGDYYDFHVSLDGTLTVVIGDATGHGMKAGTMVTAAKSLFNSYAPNPDILYSFSEITRCIKQLNMGKMSMCLTMLKIKGDKMQISTAGMPPSFIFRSDTRVVEEHLFKAMPLGTMEKFPYEVKDTALKQGDTILLISDGLPELENVNGEMYGYKRIRNGFEDIAEKSPEEIIRFLKEEGKSWSDDQTPDDDVTFVVIKMK